MKWGNKKPFPDKPPEEKVAVKQRKTDVNILKQKVSLKLLERVGLTCG